MNLKPLVATFTLLFNFHLDSLMKFSLIEPDAREQMVVSLDEVMAFESLVVLWLLDLFQLVFECLIH